MNERVKLRIDGCVVDATLIEKPVGHDKDDVRFRDWSVIFDSPIEFDEHFEPNVEVERGGVWIDARWRGIPKKGGSTAGFVTFPDPE